MRLSFETVVVSADEVREFNKLWPSSELKPREHWFTFAANGDLVDTNVGDDEAGPASAAMSEDCWHWLKGTKPAWALDE